MKIDVAERFCTVSILEHSSPPSTPCNADFQLCPYFYNRFPFVDEARVLSRSEYRGHSLMREFDAQAIDVSILGPLQSVSLRKTHKVAALAGTALAIAGPNPGKNAFTPPLA
jgi:hypothetical protein